MKKIISIWAVTQLLIECSGGQFLQAMERESVRSSIVTLRRSACEIGMTAFQSTLYPILRKNCTSCHDNGGTAAPHSQEDVRKSYSRVTGYVNWKDLNKSFIVTKVAAKHWQSQGATVNVTGEEIEKALSDWWANGQNGCPLNSVASTSPVSLSGLTADGAFTKVSWPIGETIELLDGAVLEVDIAKEQNPTRYTFRRPRLTSVKQPVTVIGLDLIFDGGDLDEGHAFQTIRSTIGVGSSPVLSSGNVTVLDERDSQEVSIGFRDLQTAISPTCKKLSQFTAAVAPVLEQRSCYRCHGGGPDLLPGESPAKDILPMALPPKRLCSELLQRGMGPDPSGSPLIAYPLERANGHPRAIVYPTEVFPAWVDWLSAELGPTNLK